MNSPTITMERDEALQQLDAYQRAARENPRLATRVDRHLMRGFRLLARGKRLIDVNKAIAHGGIKNGMPAIAISRAHVESVEFRKFDLEFQWNNRGLWKCPADTFSDTSQLAWGKRAIVPAIPLPHRPRASLDNYYLLWEADWVKAPHDPYLLRPIFGAVMEIVAEWDLTELEMAAVNAAAVR